MDASTPDPVICQLPDPSEDIAGVREAVAQFAAGELTEAELKHCCAPMGLYEQREAGLYMARVRLAAGAILPHQMHGLAEVSARYGNGILHFTTRQSLQVHGVPRHDLAEALVALQAAGLSTKGTGGDTVRNVATCPNTGVCPHQVFEVGPHAIALNEFLLPDEGSYQLPRKFKISLSGCASDCAGATVSDVGFIATIRDGARGFVVYAGGGLGARSAAAQLLEDFVPEADVLLIAEAIKRVFSQHGNRENRGRARLRFLIEERGFAVFEELYRQELAKLRETGLPELVLRPLPQPSLPKRPVSADSSLAEDAGFKAWVAANVTPQAQPGRHTVGISLPLGDIAAGVLRELSAVVESFGDGLLRATASQNASLRWVLTEDLPELYRRLAGLGLTGSEPAVLQNLVNCPGASTCRPGLLLSRGLAEAVADQLRASGLNLAAFADLSIKISGCPNACGRHPVADIGFSGMIRRVDDKPVPHYKVHLGGVVRAGKTRLARVAGTLPGRSVPAFLTDLLAVFASSPQFPDFTAFVDTHAVKISELVAAHEAVPAFDDDSSYYCEWGSDEAYSPKS